MTSLSGRLGNLGGGDLHGSQQAPDRSEGSVGRGPCAVGSVVNEGGEDGGGVRALADAVAAEKVIPRLGSARTPASHEEI